MTRFMIVLIFVLAGCASKYEPNKSYKLTLLHTNDHHGRFWSNKDGEWGLSARSTLIKSIRKEANSANADVLLLDAGDVNTGIPQSDMLDAEPDFKGMSRLQYDAMAVGNHEFDNNLEVIRKQESWAGFPFLSANIYKDGKRLFKPYIIKNMHGLKVAILGLTTKDTPLKSKMEGHVNVEFRDPIEEAKLIVPELRKKVQIVIALTHMGHFANENHGADSPGDVTLARTVSGIDIIIGGHTQIPLFKPDIQNGTIIVQAYEWGKYLGKIDVVSKNGKLELKNYELIPINHKDQKEKIAEDKELKEFLAPFKSQGDKTLLVAVGKSDEKLEGDRAVVRFKETNLGNIVTEAYRSKFGADIGLANAGGIRDSIPAGVINYESILTVLPFGNDIVTVQLSGMELKAYLSRVLSELTPGSGSYAQMTGVKATFNLKNKTFSKLVIANKPIEMKKIYTLALPSFIAGGGDNWPDLRSKNLQSFGFMDADVVREYITKHGTFKTNEFGPFDNIKILK
ncbi:MAG: 5'-nucleotidase C-terminal domain-containing protein [Bacteriovoracaceae bacterium]|nr:5'-nucleotidase C-terminal domain-containing protein [Bacteriovoracaceae bacterium]